MEPTQLPALLSPHWAFVVQVRQGSGFTHDTLHGRIEHLVSGQAALFTSVEELVAFIEQTLTTQGEDNQ